MHVLVTGTWFLWHKLDDSPCFYMARSEGLEPPDTLVRSLILNNKTHYKSTTYDASNQRNTA